MKPISLKIKGFQSFTEEQTIDFAKLSEHGIFGIFGHTGSGKSTILDSIIYVLYGKIPRFNDRELVHLVNSDSQQAEVLFEFEIGMKESRNRYCVERVATRKNGGLNVKIARVSKYIDGVKVPLNEKVSESEKLVQSIIGLNAEDFTRSVVLPQGCFSEFLKLAAKDRAQMIERIFGLEDYGTRLQNKTKERRDIYKQEVTALENKLSQYTDISAETKRNLEEICILNENELKKAKQYMDTAASKLKESEYLWKKSDEYSKNKEELGQMLMESGKFTDAAAMITKGERVIPMELIIGRVENLNREKDETQKEIDIEGQNIKKADEVLLAAEDKYTRINSKREKELPVLTVRKSEIEKILGLYAEKNGLSRQVDIKNNEIGITIKNIEELNSKLKNIKEEINSLNTMREESRKLIEECSFSHEYFEETAEKYNLGKEYEKLEQQAKELLIKMNAEKEAMEAGRKTVITENENIDKLETRIRETENEIIEKTDDYERKRSRYAELLSKSNLTKNIAAVDEFIKIYMYNTEKYLDEYRISDMYSEKKEEGFLDAVKLLYSTRESISSGDTKELAEITGYDEYEKKTKTEIEKLRENVKESEKEKYNKKAVVQTTESKIAAFEKRIFELGEEIGIVNRECSRIKDNIVEFKNRFGIDKLKDEYIRLKGLSVKKAEQEKNFYLLNEKLEKHNKKRDEMTEKLPEYTSMLAKISSESESAKKRIAEMDNDIRAVCGNAQPEILLEETIGQLKHIDSEFAGIKEEMETAKKFREKTGQNLASLKGKILSLSETLGRENGEMEKLLKNNGFDSIEEVKGIISRKPEIEKLKKIVKEYEDKKSFLISKVNELEIELNGKFISKEMHEKEVETHKIFLDEYSEKNEKRIKDAKELETVAQKLEIKNSFEKERAVSQKNYDLTSDLMELLKGNKFVEYVARNRMEYIAKKASVLLKKITCDRYALEIDDDGSFIMRDDHNGGIRRNAKTLSGGETFLTSLSLALALSSHIQLKGHAPLEFFFLDEGFGTLDRELINIVMDALENLHSDMLTVGLISHVDELKERIPKKLLVSPAIPGIRGTRVEIE